ncbi:MAG: asparaginase [Terriglobia bacterium]
MVKKTLFLFTGGTISMKIDPELGVAVPVLSGEEILSFVPGLDQLCEFEILDFSRLPGPHMTPEKMVELSDLLNQQLARKDVQGAVITHGTDTLEETAFLLDLRLQISKPVAIVGAMRNSSELGWDGPANLKAAVRVVLEGKPALQGILIVMNEQILAASEATKTHAESVNTFQSPNFGPLGMIDKDRIVWMRQIARRQTFRAGPIESRVDLVKMVAGSDDRLIQMILEKGTKGLVIEGTGRGNVPPPVLPGIQSAIDQGIPVVIATRCQAGRVLDTYGYEGGGRDLRRRGAIFAGFLPGQKARIKLMVVLGQVQELAEVKRLMEEGAY